MGAGPGGASASLQAGWEHRLPPALATRQEGPLTAHLTHRPARRGLRVAHTAAAHLCGPQQGQHPAAPPTPPPPRPRQGPARAQPAGRCGAGGEGQDGHATGTTAAALPQLSVAPQFLPRSLRVADLAANEVTEIFPLTFGEKPALRYSPWPSPGPAGSCVGLESFCTLGSNQGHEPTLGGSGWQGRQGPGCSVWRISDWRRVHTHSHIHSTHTVTYIHPHIHTGIHTHTLIHTHSLNPPTHSHIIHSTHSHTHTFTYSHSNSHIHSTHTATPTHPHKSHPHHSHTHSDMHTHTHTHTHRL